jgi:hypothetical protein
MKVRVEKRRRALARRELDEARPVDRTGREHGQLGVGRGLRAGTRTQQEQSRLGGERGARGHGRYDVVLVRLPLPMPARWAALHVPLVTRQHVVVSAPKMLLGSSVGFS